MSEQQVLPEFIATLKAAAEKATPGPYEYREVDGLAAIAHPKGWLLEDENENLDKRYIAAVPPESILKLLASLAQSEAERERLQHTNDTLTSVIAIQVEKISSLECDKSKPVVTAEEQ